MSSIIGENHRTNFLTSCNHAVWELTEEYLLAYINEDAHFISEVVQEMMKMEQRTITGKQFEEMIGGWGGLPDCRESLFVFVWDPDDLSKFRTVLIQPKEGAPPQEQAKTSFETTYHLIARRRFFQPEHAKMWDAFKDVWENGAKSVAEFLMKRIWIIKR